jgi:hypothetical protein
MTARNVLACVATLLLGLLVAAAPRAAAQEAKPFERVEYRAEKEDAAVASLVLLTPTTARMVSARPAETVDGTWSVVRGPLLRFVRPNSFVRYFTLVKDGAAATPSKDLLRPVAGVSWHEAVLADAKLAGVPRAFVAQKGRHSLTLHDDGSCDWSAGNAGPIIDVRREPSAGDDLALVFPDGTLRLFRPDGDAWMDVAGKERYAPIGELADKLRDSQQLLACQNNLSQLAQVFVIARMENSEKATAHDGVALPLSWRKTMSMIRRGDEAVLRCPGDPHLRPLDDAARSAYDAVDLAKPDNDLCSYAFRDFTRFPIGKDDRDRQIIACCRQGRDGRTPHHRGRIVVAYDSGDVTFLNAVALGLGPDEPVVVGPDSKVEALRKLVQVPTR